MASLNIKQRQYVNHIFDSITNSKCQVLEFVTGGAGVGKSHLIKAIFQSITRHFMKDIGVDLDCIAVLLCAPTGKAAFNINGVTIHSAFQLPVNQYNGKTALSADISNTMLNKLMNLKLIIIDEISMVGAKMFSLVDSRLKQIFKTDKAFGDKSVIVFGDFNQLPPVADKFVFQTDITNP
ncbi:ATP-dependent DNA helicase PIF1-like protein [Leptotrombidium deliense]|uniref:ATP-dependent DNA helicase n=1 Tax=Leptotrombidium deliense TaxID=299467 RepID=A0A443RSM2_9ACAR|nr:ATP-dependent DNA helicase PIF1-like protein [Leptotrombidium deliense]